MPTSHDVYRWRKVRSVCPFCLLAKSEACRFHCHPERMPLLTGCSEPRSCVIPMLHAVSVLLDTPHPCSSIQRPSLSSTLGNSFCYASR